VFAVGKQGIVTDGCVGNNSNNATKKRWKPPKTDL
jgi:hypothetical protein